MPKSETYEILIEMPEGETRRLHIAWSRAHWINQGPIRDTIPVNGGAMPIAYGFVIGTRVSEGPGKVDELDALVYSRRKFSVGERTRARPIASIRLENGDHKVVFADDTVKAERWADIPEAKRKLVLEYFGYKSRVEGVGDREDALELIRSCITDNPLPIPESTDVRSEG
jgi:inorganic pyrophosphatase